MYSVLTKKLTVSLVGLLVAAGLQGRYGAAQASAREDAIEQRIDRLDFRLNELQADTKDMAAQLSALRVQLARFRMALQAEMKESSEGEEPTIAGEKMFRWQELEPDVVDVLNDDRMLTQVFLDVAKVFDLRSGLTVVEGQKIASRARPIVEELIESGRDSRWRDEALFGAILVSSGQGPDRDLDRALRYLNELWNMRDRIRIEEEFKDTAIYDKIPTIHVGDVLERDGIELSGEDVAAVSIKLQMSDVYQQMERYEQAERLLEEAYELAGRPLSGEFFREMYTERKISLEKLQED